MKPSQRLTEEHRTQMQVSQNRRVMDRQAILPRTPNEVLSSALLRQNARAHFLARHEINLYNARGDQ